jgi:hypothetical protein
MPKASVYPLHDKLKSLSTTRDTKKSLLQNQQPKKWTVHLNIETTAR